MKLIILIIEFFKINNNTLDFNKFKININKLNQVQFIIQLHLNLQKTN